MKLLKTIFFLFKDSVTEFLKDRASIFAAGLAYYTIFSLAPLLVFITAIAGIFIGRSAAGEEIARQLEYLFGAELAGFVQDVVETLASRASSNTIATVVSIVVLIIGAGGIFRQLKTAFNLIWGITDVRPKNLQEWLVLVRYRAIPFLMLFLFGLLLSVAVVLETVLDAVSARFEVLFPEAAFLLPGINRLIVPLLTFITFLLIFKFLPDAYTRWRDVAVGALLTTGLFLVGRVALTIFLSYSDTGSIYGAAGSIIILLVWIYYSAQILLFGAEFIWVYTRTIGQPIRPNRMSMIVESMEEHQKT